MKNIKKLCKVAMICMCIVLSTMSVPIVSNAQEVDYQVEPRMTYISTCSSSLSISDSGVATVYGMVRGKTGVTYTYVKVTLQKLVSGEWVDVESWEASNNSRATTVNETYQVSIGTYHVVVECTANSESKTITSAEKTY